ncbi:unnamed protein product [Protopolystoma xenopodis]|uniref:Ryanodine receptor junctional solenoid domain-containing protein n=1 Tax=Protopolystoma xenopodis TaxID=117903 RepID=A0A3S5AZ74_9PLAT|nr:unnamed protein product [Protopolystoma xenopodis]
MPLPESVQLELCRLLNNLCDLQLRNRIELIVLFANIFVSELQKDQQQRYLTIKHSNLPSSVAARRTREFRCPPDKQMRCLLRLPGPNGPTGLLHEEGDGGDEDAGEMDEVEESLGLSRSNPCTEEIKELLRNFHRCLTDHFGVVRPEEEGETGSQEEADSSSPGEDTVSLSSSDSGIGRSIRGSSIGSGIDSTRISTARLLNLSLAQWSAELAAISADTDGDMNSATGLAGMARGTLNSSGTSCRDPLMPPQLAEAIAKLPLLPDSVGNPEEGSGGPPRILKALWQVIAKPLRSAARGEKTGHGRLALMAGEVGGMDEDEKCKSES